MPKHVFFLNLCSVFIVEQSVPNGILCVDGGKSGSFRITVRYVRMCVCMYMCNVLKSSYLNLKLSHKMLVLFN